MGWWSAAVLGGDTPLDALAELERAIGFRDVLDKAQGFYYLGDAAPELLVALHAHPQRLEALFAEAAPLNDRASDPLRLQAWACAIMRIGGPITAPMRTAVLRAIEHDSWEPGVAARSAALASLRHALEHYEDGVPTEIPSEASDPHRARGAEPPSHGR